MDESTWDLPDNPILMPGPMTVGSLTRVDNSEANAVGEVLRAERVKLWRDLVQGNARLERENVALRDRVVELEAQLAARD